MSVVSLFCLVGLGCVYNVIGQRTTHNGCTCTTLPELTTSKCGQESGGQIENDVIRSMKAVITAQQKQLALLSQQLTELQERVTNLESMTTPQNQSIKIDEITFYKVHTQGTHYIRWGRTSCPDSASIIYEGHTAKSHYSHTGGGADYICLDKDPQWPDNVTAAYQSGSYIYGVEYQTLTVLPSSLTENDAPCAVCHVNGRGEQLMIPGKRMCPVNWTKEYEGILVAANSKHTKSSFVCLDAEPETVPGHHESTNGGLFYTVEARCTALPCPPFVNGYEVACVVCTL